MGEVYRARDPRLDRTVAIKILPSELSGDASRRQRFEREAKVISSLNHPHICTLYDIGRQDSVDFIVMEFLEGESLAELLDKGPLPEAQVLRYGTQIASALDKAHRNGVTHRDLKPGNIMLTASGAKLLDFGLAKAEPAAATGAKLTDMTPQATPMTQHGAVIGTVPYMSPEQVEGNEVDVRSDIFSLGAVAVLFVTGSRRMPPPLAFRQLNFRREAVFNAAFASDEDIVVYSAAGSGNTPQMFVVRPDYPEPQSLGPPGTHLLAVSSKGELAVLLDARYVWFRLFTSTLARMPLSGGAPRQVQEGVRQADWSPDGSQLAIIREVAGKDRLEYPIGNVLREVSGYMSDLRVSPKGDRIAYFEHPRKWDDRGSLNLVDLKGKNAVLSDGYWSERGLAWSPNGDEILFSASHSGGSFTVYAVTPSGSLRVAYQPPGGLTIEDLARDGRWLATRVDYRYAAMVHTPGDTADRNLSWLNTSHARGLSPDGQTLLFAETGLGTNYDVCLRKTDGSPVVRLGEGWAASLSADGKWALAIIQSHPPQLVIYPTGAGQTQQIKRGAIENYSSAQWFPDGKSVLIGGNEAGKGPRFYFQQLGADQEAQPLTPEGTRDGWLSYDGRLVLARGPENKYFIYPIAGGEPRPVPALAETDVLSQWSADQHSALVYRRAQVPCRLERVDLASGRRTLFKEFAPADRVGLLSMREIVVTDDLSSYAYTAYYQVSSLFVSEAEK
jgi:serine/threonine protein kinase